MTGRPVNPAQETALQRTRLAWRRTTLAVTVASLLLLTNLVRDASLIATAVVGLAIAGCWFAVVLIAYRRIRQVSAGPASALGRSPALLGLLVASFALIGLAALLARG